MEAGVNSPDALATDEVAADRSSGGGAVEEPIAAKDETGRDSLSGGAPKEEGLTAWELAGDVGDAEHVVDQVPAAGEEGGVRGDEPDVESFSLESFVSGSGSEEGSEGGAPADAGPAQGLSKVFDLKLLQTVIEASQPALDTVTGKDVVMVTGKTGVGKSTLIQGIAGKHIRKIKHTTSFSGEVASKTVFAADDPLEAFEIGHTMTSKTSSINALVRGKDGAEIVYLDSPGVEDTSGIEMDIATSAVLSQVAKRCKSLRFVILIHCASLLEDRGGAFRSVLKFARTFVQDFSESKLSFMFLFTHTDEITGMSVSVDHAKKRLQEEIIRISDGTTDEDVLFVLNFIRRSLTKNYLLASIFHPIEMDYSKLTFFIEKKLKKVTDMSIASSCNLTLASKLKLDSAVQNLVQSLRVSLRESSQDIEQVKDIEKRLQYLAKYIDVDCVRNAASESRAIIDEYIEHLNSSIEGLTRRGTSSGLEFNKEHIQATKTALSQLHEFGATRTRMHHLRTMEASLLKFKDEIIANVRSQEKFHTEMNKVSIWAEGFDEIVPIYTGLCETVSEYVQGLSTAPSEVNIPNLDQVSRDDIGIFLSHLYKLNAMCEQLIQFHVTGVDIESAVIARDSVMQALSDVFKRWTLDAEKFSNASNFADYEDELEVIVSRLRLLDFIQESLQSTLKDHNRMFSCLEDPVINTKKGMEDSVSRRFNQCCTQLKGSAFDLSWKPPLLWLQAVCDGFAGVKGLSGKQLQSSLFSVLDKSKSALCRSSGELENMSHMIKVHGMTSGENLAKELIYLERCKWFDMFLPPDERFVEKSCDNIRHFIDTWIKEKQRKLESVLHAGGAYDEEEMEFNASDSGKEVASKKRKRKAQSRGKKSTTKGKMSNWTKKRLTECNSDNIASSLEEKDELFRTDSESEMEFRSDEDVPNRKKDMDAFSFSIISSGSSKSITEIGLMLPELHQIDGYSRVVDRSSSLNLTAKSVGCLECYVGELGDLANTFLGHWTSNIEKGRIGYMRSITRKLNYILADVQALLTTSASDIVTQESKSILSKIHSEFERFNNVIKNEFSTFNGCFDKKVAFLVSIKACIGFAHVESQCIKYNKLKDCARDLVSKYTAKLERAIGATSDWDQIDKRLDNFKAALVLDPFVGGEVSTRLRTLTCLREQKEEQVTDLMQDMIQNRNFKGIGEFLTPYSCSQDQVKKSLFKQHQDSICCSLEETVNEIYRLLDDDMELVGSSKRAAENMDILVAAKSELNNLLLSRYNLAYEMPKLKRRIKSIITAFTENIIDATAKVDFIQMQVNRRQGSFFLESMVKHLPTMEINRFQAAREKSKRVAEGIPQDVEKFFTSRFEEGHNLFKVMAGLKRAAETGSYPKLADLYETTRKDIESKSLDTLKLVETVYSESQCYDDLIQYTHSFHRHLQGSLRDHCSSKLIHKCERVIEDLRQKKKTNDSILDFGGGDYEKNVETLSKRLDHLSSTSIWGRFWRSDSITYDRLCNDLRGKVEGRFNQAQVALKARDFVTVQECIDFLELIHKKAQKHVNYVGTKIEDIRDKCTCDFLKLCDEAKHILGSDNVTPFEEIFPDYRSFVINISCILKSSQCQKGFALVNQLLHESLSKAVSALAQLAGSECFDSSRLRSQVLYTRLWGNFVADRLTLLHEEINVHTSYKPDKWLVSIHTLCWDHFNHGRDLSKTKECVILGVLPSAAKSDINKAYKEKALRYHPDKRGPCSNNAMFRKINDSRETLLTMNHLTISTQTQPFDEILIGIGENLRGQAKQFMLEQRYGMAEKLLFELTNIKVLDDLVTPKLKSDETKASVYSLVKGYIEKGRVEVNSNWSARNYKELNNIITDLKKMESHFKAYPTIFPKSWDTGICSTVETEIESLGQKASVCLTSRSLAKQKEGDFRRCFIQMGFVLVELPLFKDFTKSVMSGVLEICLDSDWGYSYLFELGLSLQKGDGSNNDNENRIAQMIVTEFNHFKEVLTMVWNEETSQKPAEDVVMHIKGNRYTAPTQFNPLDVDTNQLLESFKIYEREYKSLLGDYIKPEADLNILVNKTLTLANKILPSQNGDKWGEVLKKKIPALLAGVFSLFTVLKSGASYNRIEAAAGSSNLGEKLLMKPHNIQVLTLLYMLGCGNSGQTSLESQLMQIRTGEGKSMILGAAAVIFALLGFRVRTVCYSEYLSTRDFKLFEEVFDRYSLTQYIKYSKITTYAEDSTAAKGDIRSLTEALLRGTLATTQPSTSHHKLDNSNTKLNSNTSSSKAVGVDKDGSSLKSITKPPSASNDSLKQKPSTTSSGEGSETIVKPPLTNGSLLNNSNGKPTCLARPTDRKQDPLSTLSRQASKNTMSEYDVELGKEQASTEEREEILLVDEVDVFFGPGFYGQTYNQVIEFREPEIEEILKRIWNAWNQGGRRLKLSDIKAMPEYGRLLAKLSSFSFLLDNELSLMLNQVSKVDDVPYYLDPECDRIGYKVMDGVSYDVTYGYATVFTYLKEHQKLKDKATLSKVLAMLVSCGQFSYANINPHRILGVSGTLQALGESELDVLLKYGLNRFIFVPSVYGASNFVFDKAGGGIYFENNKSDFFHRISAEITSSTKSKQGVIVFFQDRAKLNEFCASPTYRQLSRHKKLLTEDMNATDKGYTINKAATAGQITLSTAVFGRGTDFFCKDDVVQQNGGVHVIQTFLSEQLSEEIQIQGRTARQGKRGSYQMVLLESDLESAFGVCPGEKDKVPKKDMYDWLCSVRMRKHKKQCKIVGENLSEATEKDNATHKYFNSLLACNTVDATKEFEVLYHLMKKAPMPSSLILDLAFAIDVTGSMAPYSKCLVSTIDSLISGQHSILEKLKSTFPEIEFRLRVGCLGFRDIDDSNQFEENVWREGGHFTDDIAHAMQGIKSTCLSSHGGADIAEDHIGAICHCAASWNDANDWTSDIKCLMLFTDAPCHGLAIPSLSGASNYDNYPTRHPSGLTLGDATSSLLSKDIDLFFCSFDPDSTARTEEELSKKIKEHPDNKSPESGITQIPMVPKGQHQTNGSSSNRQDKHIIFVLDESGSMSNDWNGVVDAYRKYIEKLVQRQSDSDIVSVVQFDSSAHVTVNMTCLSATPQTLSFRGGGTYFHPAALDACNLARATPATHTPVIIFMSDGGSCDAADAAQEFSQLNSFVSQKWSNHLELHVIAFGGGANTKQLQLIAGASSVGKVHASANTADLTTVFVSIATNQNVATLLESEIAKRISEAVSDKLSLEYFGS